MGSSTVSVKFFIAVLLFYNPDLISQTAMGSIMTGESTEISRKAF